MQIIYSTNLEPAQRRALNRGNLRRLLSYILLEPPSHLRFSWNTRGGVEDYLNEIAERRIQLMLDSGAYSAWSRNVKIELEDYAKFILKYPKAFNVVVNLDVIPGKPNEARSRTPSATEKAAAEGFENWKALRKLLKPLGNVPIIHVFHKGEDKKWLKKIMDESDYLGLGPGHGRPEWERQEWLNSIMPTLTDKKGWPLCKFHGFAVTSEETMRMFPWHSVDSTSWVMTGRFGGCYIKLGNKTHKVVFSDDSPSKTEHGKHFSSYSRPEREVIEKFLAQRGLTSRMVSQNYCLSCNAPFKTNRSDTKLTCCSEPQPNVAYMQRDVINIDYYTEMERTWVPRPWTPGEADSGFTF